MATPGLSGFQGGEEEEPPAPVGASGREWQYGSGYQMRAPDAKRRSQLERVARADEEAVRKLELEKRAEGLRCLSESSGGQLGSKGEATSMHDARLAFARRLEQESDPKARRRIRLQEESQKREEEKKQRLSDERRQMEDWRQRQQKSADLDRKLNQAKQSHWQHWDEQRSALQVTQADRAIHAVQLGQSSACSDEVVANSTSAISISVDELAGRWLHGNKPSEYLIRTEDSGQLYFDGPCPEGGRLTGLLLLVEGYHQAELQSSKDSLAIGTMRFRVSETNDGIRLISNFKKAGSLAWGKDVRAWKADETKNSVVLFEEPRPAMRTGYEDQLIDEDVWQCRYCTLINPTQLSCCNACGNAQERLDSRSVNQVADSRIEMPDGRSGPAGHAPQASILDPRSGVPHCGNDDLLEEPVARVGSVTETVDTLPTLAIWLAEHRLEMYLDKMLELGFEDLGDMLEAGPQDLEDMFQLVGVKPGHISRFRNGLRRTSRPGRESASNCRECPVCLAGPMIGVDVALTPCGHVFCSLHATQALSSQQCPVCRKQPRNCQRIYD
eukprot:TRINITY_DN46930_c0_g1_i1.p1 TRINITY_DN46930_c0_g1~~TRINITY_DN46930_c0_g1_i1.p1  ORF type:complete len:574 (+),score=117.08 TRINITY_DN46930_c0_g1_i1:55-1722(+)